MFRGPKHDKINFNGKAKCVWFCCCFLCFLVEMFTTPINTCLTLKTLIFFMKTLETKGSF